ncbi:MULTISPECIES: hypothetical protein [unclassified Halomonas]|uniref:DUF7282 domain-containing protein n=1 Tax=unclassified Halomonas TaxID=2609666 RepID=UPI0028859C2E|nr:MULTISPECIES: hypothetical protein [unclassified Halomonas]MDT0499983.1 hypothetical protein [Halomonas sp. PAR7]MDT0512387.1 hypothetical protein [Halomonas sp. LES1]MDT0591021.1 hypothetical protein [Halomonas sp. PAR8]
MPIRHSLIAAALTLGLVGSAVAAEAPRLEVSAQAPGSRVTVEAVSLAEDGFVVVHASDAEGKIVAPASIGHVAVAGGEHTAVEVPLEREVAAGERLYVMLHRDTGTPGEYAFGPGSVDVDPPLVVDGKPVVRSVAVQ